MVQPRDVSRSTTAFVPDETVLVVVEMSRSTWLVARLLPGVDRRPLKKLEPDQNSLIRLLESWCQEAVAAGPLAGAGSATEDRAWLDFTVALRPPEFVGLGSDRCAPFFRESRRFLKGPADHNYAEPSTN
jgi:hypothetical protein